MYSLPPSPGESRAAAEQRRDRHRRREETAIRAFEVEVSYALGLDLCEATAAHYERQRLYAHNVREGKQMRQGL